MIRHTPIPNDSIHIKRLRLALGEEYELRQALGRGGFATVYAAFDLRLKREVAVKVLRPELDSPVVRERFRREAEAVASLRHPHIIPIHAVGEGEGLTWFVMPLIRGESLRARLERSSPLSLIECRRIFTEIADALAAAHRAGLIHRDVKPDNILLEAPEARVVLTDFGIAKAVAGGDRPESLTETGLILGTPQYMSPEQAGGEVTVDPRSDLYSLGVVGYSILTGEMPFAGATVSAILMNQLAGPAPLVEQRRPACPRDLSHAIARCLEREPTLRWTSADELLIALEPGTLPPPLATAAPGYSSASQVRRFRRNAAAWFAASAVAFALDLLDGSIQFAPLLPIIGAFLMAAQYSKLWMGGWSWRDVVGIRGRRADGQMSSGAPKDSPALAAGPDADFRDPVSAVHQVRNDRTAIVRLLAQLPRAERTQLPELIPALDRLVALVDDFARQDRTIRGELDTASAMPQKARKANVLGERLDEIHTRIGEAASAMARLRAEVESIRSMGAHGTRSAIDDAFATILSVLSA